jgi:serine/threonine protein phosphatase PrpC
MSHVLSRAVGTEAELRYDATTDKAMAGDRYLLCSDGLTKVMDDAEVAGLLGQGGIDAAADRLIERTLAAGAPDNTSLVILSAEEVTAVCFVPA